MEAALRVPGIRGKEASWLALVAIAAAPMGLILVLVGVLIWVSFQRGIIGTAGATYSLANYRTILGDPFAYRAMANTAVFVLVTTGVALAIGVPIAWLTERTTLRAKAIVYAIMTAGLLMPGIYTAMGWTFIAHPRIGFVNRWLQALLGVSFAPINVVSPAGMGFVQGLSLTPLAFILTVRLFGAMNPALEEAAKVHGMSLATSLRRITLPLAQPGILAATIYIATIAIATFDVPAILGLGNRVYLLSTFVYIKANPFGTGVPEHGVTAATGALMIVLALGLTLWYGQVLRQSHRYEVITGRGYRPMPIALHAWEAVAWGLILGYAFIADVLPLLLIASAAFTPYLMPPSPELLSRLSLINFQNMDWELVARGLRNTAVLALAVPVAVVIFGFCISWLVVRARGRGRFLLEFGAFLPHALPDAILAVGASLLALFVVRRVLPLYGSIWLIAIVYLIVRLAFATRALTASLLQIHRELEEAAFTAGLSVIRTARRVVLPLLRPTVLGVWIWTVLLVYRELTVAAFLVSHDNITLQVVIWSYWSAGGPNKAAAVTLLMTLAVTPLLVLFWWFGRRSRVVGA